MVKKVRNICIIIILIVLVIMTIYKLNKRHEDKLYDVLYSEIKYQARKCYLKSDCKKNITLNELYEKKYLTIQYDPISKEELDKDLKIKIKGEKIEIVN